MDIDFRIRITYIARIWLDRILETNTSMAGKIGEIVHA